MAEIVNGDRTENVQNFVPRAHSRVPFSYRFANTLRFGEYSPFFSCETVNGDKIPLSVAHSLRSYTLKSPIMSDMSIHKDLFYVPMEAILPLNWEKVYVNPPIGDDVVANYVNCVLPLSETGGYMVSICNHVDGILGNIFNLQTGQELVGYKLFCNYMVWLERFLSCGSLLNVLECSLWKTFNPSYSVDIGNVNFAASDYESFDQFFDAVMGALFFYLQSLTSFQIIRDGVHYNLLDIDLRRFCELIREDTNFTFSTSATTFDAVASNGSAFSGQLDKDINLSRVLAYQIVCAHFYTNDKVDYIYNANLYRQNVKSIMVDLGILPAQFTYNGIDCDYDVLSGYSFNMAMADMSSQMTAPTITPYFDLWRLIFGFNRSLRYVDYFSGSRTRPLAVGDVNVNVVSGQVNAVDMTKGIQTARFLNFVNKVGRSFEEYVSKLGGKYVAPDYHNPFALVQTSDRIDAVENENTGPNQLTSANSVTSVYRSGSGKYMFEMTFDRPSVVIGIAYFDIPRFYGFHTDRHFFHVDRFDMFNNFMQFVGDQEVYNKEFSWKFSTNAPFGYQSRNQEYKTRVDACAGAFANDFLPSWIYKVEDDESLVTNIGPEFIRSRSTELDKFFVSLSGCSLGTYFHFICKFTNECNPVRPMVYQPQILG